MELVELSSNEYLECISKSKQKSFYQSLSYARFLEELGFDYDLIGLKDSYNNIRALSMIAYKKCIGNYYYGYAPGGFVIDYNDYLLVKDFSNALKRYYKRKNIVFIKIVPNIIIGRLNKLKKEFINNENVYLINKLKHIDLNHLKNNLYFESLLPKYRPLIDLKRLSYNNLNKSVRNKIRKCYRKGLTIQKGSLDNIKDIYPFIKNKNKYDIKYYESLYHSFENNIDIFLVNVNFEDYLINMQNEYEEELQKNNLLVKKIQSDPSDKNLDRKMQSDKELLNIKNNIVIATNGLSKGENAYIAGAIVIKYDNEVIIFESGYDKKYKECNANYFLNYKIMEYYKNNYDILDMNGFSGDLTKSNPYYGVNEFKLGFNCDVYETIGEFDLVFNSRVYKKLIKNGTLAKLFDKKK